MKRGNLNHGCFFHYRLGFSVFLNSGNTNETTNDNNDHLPEACQINMDYAGKYKEWIYRINYSHCK